MPIRHKWNLGFEIECAFFYNANARSSGLRAFRNKIKSLNSDIKFSEDYSVELRKRELPASFGHIWLESFPLEIKTPPLGLEKSLELAEKCFSLMSESTVQTNSTCGLHANFSPALKSVYDRVNLAKVQISPYWVTVAKAFGRDKNYYCKPMSPESEFIKSCAGLARSPRPIGNQLYRLIWYVNKMRHYEISERPSTFGLPLIAGDSDYLHKGQSISLRNWHTVKKPTSRVELRALGNKNYHKNPAKVREYILGSVEALEQCLD